MNIIIVAMQAHTFSPLPVTLINYVVVTYSRFTVERLE